VTGSPTPVLFDTVLVDLPDVRHALTELHDTARAAVDPALLGLCAARIAWLLGAEDVTELPTQLSDTDRACLAFTEQFVVDVAAMDDATVGAVLDVLGADGLVNFTNALLVVEQRIRLQLMWTRLLT